MQLAYCNEDGVLATLRYNNRWRWINENIIAFFSVGGPLGSFHPICADVFKHHLKKTENQDHVNYNRTHSNRRGSEHEDVPEQARAFFPYFEALDNSETATQRAFNIREARNRVVASLISRKAPLGPVDNKGPVALPNETSPNRGHTTTIRQVEGNVNMEHARPQEGRDDSYVCNPAPRQQIQSGVQIWNVHLASFSPQHNNPST